MYEVIYNPEERHYLKEEEVASSTTVAMERLKTKLDISKQYKKGGGFGNSNACP